MTPHFLAMALQADGWYLRQEIIWAKPAPMPESVTDRCTKAHEHVFLLTKNATYFYDAVAIAEPASEGRDLGLLRGKSFADPKNVAWHAPSISKRQDAGVDSRTAGSGTRNKRSVWTVAASPYAEAHFATYPPKLIEPMILAGTSAKGACPECGAPWERITKRDAITRERPNDYTKRTGDDGTGNSCANTVAGVDVKTTGWEPTCKCNAGDPVPCKVLDPFSGSGTTGQVCEQHGRIYIGCELNPAYAELSRKRIGDECDKLALFQEEKR